jgi:hypothetical protein
VEPCALPAQSTNSPHGRRFPVKFAIVAAISGDDPFRK